MENLISLIDLIDIPRVNYPNSYGKPGIRNEYSSFCLNEPTIAYDIIADYYFDDIN